MSESQPAVPATFWGRIAETFAPSGMPSDDRGRMRLVVDNLVLHLHPTKVPVRTLRWTYTWGLGGLSALLLMTLVLTGVFLEMSYTPQPDQAYLDILALQTNTWFGALLLVGLTEIGVTAAPAALAAGAFVLLGRLLALRYDLTLPTYSARL